ncbi:MAG: hypothetical protein L6R36_004937 [Xanthoria steineri]|nr:MAG: hypothetical protein L6R36_004937 [Xanthoria steineri]
MEEESKLALAALVVSLVALVTTISQVLSQLFATADGYRRCQPSIIGGWGRLTCRKFRWSDLRFETIYTTPRFALMPYTGNTITYERNMTVGSMLKTTTQEYNPLDGTPAMIEKTYATLGHQASGLNVFKGFNEMASWVRFIDALHASALETCMLTTSTREAISSPSKTGRAIPFPCSLLTTTGHALEDFRTLRRCFTRRRQWSYAGLHHRPVGWVVVQFTMRDPLFDPLLYPNGLEELYLPTAPADKMGFGIVPGDPRLFVPDHVIGTPADCLARTLGIDVQAGETLKDLMNENGWTPGFSDNIALAAPMIRLPGSEIIKVPRPAVYEAGLTYQQEGIVVFHNRLRDLINERDRGEGRVSEQIRWFLQQLEELSKYRQQWFDEKACKGNRTPIGFLDDLHARHDMTTDYFISLHNRFYLEKANDQVFRYTDLMYSHITHAIDYFPVARELLDAGKGRNHYGQKVQAWITEGAHVYFDKIPSIIETMRHRGLDDPPVVEEAWFTMMLRAFLWHRTHLMVGGNTVPSQHWGSRLPVYIG